MSGVVRWIVVDDLDIRDKTGAGVGAFDQVVRQKSVSGKATSSTSCRTLTS